MAKRFWIFLVACLFVSAAAPAQGLAQNPDGPKSSDGHPESAAELNRRIYANQPAHGDASIEINNCLSAVMAAGGGICDASRVTGDQTISRQINVGNQKSVPVLLVLSPHSNFGVTITNGSSCGLMVFNSGAVMSSGAPGTGQGATISSHSPATHVRGLVCTNDSLGGASNSFKIEGLQIHNSNGGKMADAAVVLRGCEDNSIFRNNMVINPFGVGLHIGGTTPHAQCTVLTVEDTWVNGSSGATNNTLAQPVLIDGSAAAGAVSSIRWVSGSIVQAGAGQNSVVIDGGDGFFAQDIDFYGVHMEGTINPADPGTAMVRISHAGPVNWFGGAMLYSYPSGSYCFHLENDTNSFQAIGVECGHNTMVENAVTGVNYTNAGGGNIHYYTDGVNSFFGAAGFTEGFFPLNAANGVDLCAGDSSAHALKCSFNNDAPSQVTRFADIGQVYNAAGTQQKSPHIVADSGVLTSGTPSTAAITLSGLAGFANNTSYNCAVTNTTTQANPLKVTYTDGSHFLVIGPNGAADSFSFHCIGN